MHRLRMSLAVLAVCGLVSAASAQTIQVYNNVTTFSGYAVSNGGATSTTGSTKLVADDITFASGSAGLPITGLQFSVGNSASVAVNGLPQIRIYADNGSNAPGTYLAGLNFNSISFTAGSVGTYTYSPGTTIFTVPSSGIVWAAMDFVAGSGTTVANLNLLGQGTFNPPTIGSSTDQDFVSTSPGTSTTGSFASSNPAGTVNSSPFAGAPVANFGWSFTATVPEPGLSLLAGALAAGAFGLRRRASV